MTAKHTPAPWNAMPEPNECEWGVDSGRWGIAICADAPGGGTAEANARLIAAAPDLLDALVGMVYSHAVPSSGCKERKYYDAAIAAIEKATGEQT